MEDNKDYFEKIRSLWTYRDEKLMRSEKKTVGVEERDEDDEELFARCGFNEKIRTSFDHLYRIRRKLYESNQIVDKRGRYMSKILEKSSKLERNRSSSLKVSRRRVPVSETRRLFLLPPESTVSESRTSKDVHDSWCNSILEPFSVCVDDLPAQILDSEEMTVHYLGCLGRASISSGSTLPLIVSARILLKWRSAKFIGCKNDSGLDDVVIDDESMSERLQDEEEKEEKIEKIEILENVGDEDHDGNSTTQAGDGNVSTGMNLKTSAKIPKTERRLENFPVVCFEDVHVIIEMLQSLSSYVNSDKESKRKTKQNSDTSDKGESNMWCSIEEYLTRSDSLNSDTLNSISSLCGYHRGLVACALRATKGDGNAAFNFLQEHAASLSMFVSGILVSSNEKRDEEICIVMSVTGKSEIACRGACGLGSANLAIGWLMDNHDTVLQDSGILDAVVSCTNKRDKNREGRKNVDSETIGTLYKFRPIKEKKMKSVENLIQNLLRSLEHHSDILTSSSESVEILLSFVKESVFQCKTNKDILINAVCACLSNLQEDETLSPKLWNKLAEMNLVSLKVLDRVTPSLDILESFLEEKTIREGVALHVIDAITRRKDFRTRMKLERLKTQIRPLLTFCEKISNKSLCAVALPLIVTKCLKRKDPCTNVWTSKDIVTLVRLNKTRCNSRMLSYAVSSLAIEYIVAKMESEPLSDIESDMSVWIDLFRETKERAGEEGQLNLEDLETHFGPDKSRSRGVFPKAERALLRALSYKTSAKGAWRAVLRLRSCLRRERSSYKSGTSTRLDMKRHENRLAEAIEKKDKQMTRHLLHGRRSRVKLSIADTFATYLNQVCDRLNAVCDLESSQVLDFALRGDLVPSSKHVSHVVKTRRRRGVARLEAMRTLRDCLCEDTAEIDRLIRGVFESLSRGVKTSNGDEDEDIAPWIRVCHIQKNVLLKNPNELNELFRDICKMILRETELSAWYWGSIEWNKDDRETVFELVRSVSSFSSSSSLIRVLTAYACVQHDDMTQGDGRRGNLMRRLKNESPFPVPKHNAPSKEWLRELLYHEYVKSHDLLYPQCLVLMRLVNCESDELKLAVKKDENARLLKVLFDEKKSTRLRRAALRLLVTHYEGENFKYVLKYVGHVVKCSKGYSVDLASDMIGLARMYLQRNQNKWNTLLSSEDDMVELGAMAVAGGWSPFLCDGGHVTRKRINTRSIVVRTGKGTKKCDILSGSSHTVSVMRSKLIPLDVVSTPASTEWLRTSLLKHVKDLLGSDDRLNEETVSRMLSTWCEHAETAKVLKEMVLKNVMRLATRPIPGTRQDSMMKSHVLARRMNAIRRLCTNKSYERIVIRHEEEDDETKNVDDEKSKVSKLKEERSRRASDLCNALGYEISLCEKALELNRDHPDRAAEWLMIHSETFMRGGGMREEAPPKGIYVGDAKRWSLARDLALTAGMPPLLCANALQIFSDRADSAMVWLLDRGSLHRDDILNPDRIDFRKVEEKDSIWDWIRAEQDDENELGQGDNDEEEEEEEEYGDILLREMMRLMGLPAGSAHHARRYIRSRTSSPFMMTASPSSPHQMSHVSQTNTMSRNNRRRRSMRITEELKVTKVRGRPEVLLRPLSLKVARPGDLVIILKKRDKKRMDGEEEDEDKEEEEEEEEEEVKVHSNENEDDKKTLFLIPWLVNVRSGALISVGKKICTIENYGDVLLSRCYRVESYFGSCDILDLTKRTQHALTILNLRRAAISMLKYSSSSNVPAPQLLNLVKYLFAKGEYDVSSKLATSLDPSVAVGDGVRQLLACTEDVKQKQENCIVIDSVHPQMNSNEPLEYSGCVQISGARALKLEFDSRSELTHRSRLEIRNSSGDLIHAFVGSRFGTVVVYANNFRWVFTSLPTSGSAWGYRFRVSSVKNVIWKTESSIAQNDASLQFACWLLDLMLAKSENIYSSNVVTALVRYMKVPDMPFKVNVVRTLIRLVWSWRRFSSEKRMAIKPLVATLRDEAQIQIQTPLVSELSAVCRVFCSDEKFASSPLRRTFSAGFLGMKTKEGVRPAIRSNRKNKSTDAVMSYPYSDLIRLGVALRDGLRIPDDLAMRTWWGKKSDTKKVEPLVLAMSRWKHENDLLLLKTKKTPDDVSRFRLALVELLNRSLITVASKLRDDLDSPTRLLIKRGIPHLIMNETKNRLIRDLVDSSTHKRLGDARLTVVLDNRRVFQSAERGNTSAETSQCIFAQVFAQLNLVSDRWLRTELDSKGRIWVTHFAGEEGIDHGGLFRSTLTSCVQDLFSKRSIDLFVECARTRRFVPNPLKRESAIARRMYIFVGKLLGVSIRIRADLPFNFDDFVWRQILSSFETNDDDEDERRCLSDLTRLNPNYVDEIQEYDNTSNFTTTRTSGETFELVSGGKYISVTNENHREYVRLAVKHRLDEYVDSIRLIRDGLLTIVPRRMLTYLGPQDLKRFACGEPTIEVSTWRSHSTYISCSRTSEFSRRFWRVLSSMNQEQRSKLLYFTWGRTRLPAEGSNDWKLFRLTRCEGNDDRLPVGHTCFFQLEMPDYSTESVMRNRLLTALEYSGGEFLIR